MIIVILKLISAVLGLILLMISFKIFKMMINGDMSIIKNKNLSLGDISRLMNTKND